MKMTPANATTRARATGCLDHHSLIVPRNTSRIQAGPSRPHPSYAARRRFLAISRG
jgi:hypothetical protein